MVIHEALMLSCSSPQHSHISSLESEDETTAEAWIRLVPHSEH